MLEVFVDAVVAIGVFSVVVDDDNDDDDDDDDDDDNDDDDIVVTIAVVLFAGVVETVEGLQFGGRQGSSV